MKIVSVYSTSCHFKTVLTVTQMTEFDNDRIFIFEFTFEYLQNSPDYFLYCNVNANVQICLRNFQNRIEYVFQNKKQIALGRSVKLGQCGMDRLFVDLILKINK